MLKAANLEDTDTTGTVTGGLAGVCFGLPAIPSRWLNQLAWHDDLSKLLNAIAANLSGWMEFTISSEPGPLASITMTCTLRCRTAQEPYGGFRDGSIHLPASRGSVIIRT